VFVDLGGFDLGFHNGYEDVDFCLRLGQGGYEVHYCHTSVLIHLESSSRPRAPELDEPNERLYLERWGDRVRPDDFDYYLADRLIQIDYTAGQAPRLAVSPALGLVDRNQRSAEIEQVLNDRSRQVFQLIEETNRLYRETLELKTRLNLAPSPLAAFTGNQLWEPAGHADRDETTGTVVVQGRPIHLSPTPSGRLISILMPIKNGAPDLEILLPKLLRQKTKDSIELVAVDSGSTDSTVQILTDFGATVVAIEPHEFNHGLTRNLAARHARGDLLVYINKKVLPANDDWLANLIRPLDRRAEVAGVCSRLMPRRDADPLTYRDVLQDLNGQTQTVIHTISNWVDYKSLPPGQLRWFINFHSVSMATRARVMAQLPFRKVKTIGEDVLWAKEVLEAGYQIHFEPTSVAFHSHNFSPEEIFQRHVDDGVLNRDVVNSQIQDHEVMAAILDATRSDWRFLDGEVRLDSYERRELHLAAFLRRSAAILGQWVGTNYDRFDPEHIKSLSLIEHTKRRSSAPDKVPASWTAVPSEEIRLRTTGDADSIQYEMSGREAVAEISALLSQHGLQLENINGLLDFGCGSGRLLRWLRETTAADRLYGCDIDPAAIGWIKTYFPDVNVRGNNPTPPLPYPDEMFELVLSWTVLNPKQVELNDWLAELQRVTQPSGRLLIAVEDGAAESLVRQVQAHWTMETVTRSQTAESLTLILARRQKFK
jgi:rhamnosyltransferase